MDWPEDVMVVIEVPRGGHVKRKDDGRIDFVSPLPCPFNYGSVPDTCSGDGDRLDAVVLGPRLARGSQVRCQVQARARFIDAGQDDPKLICGPRLGALAELEVRLFFAGYARGKGLLNRLRGKRGLTRFGGLEHRAAQTRGGHGNNGPR